MKTERVSARCSAVDDLAFSTSVQVFVAFRFKPRMLHPDGTNVQVDNG